jgi:hypothetical protein
MKAFPHTRYVYDSEKIEVSELQAPGMDLRDYFAAKAMQGLVTTVKGEEWHAEETAEIAYFVADAMMKERGNK